MKKKHVIVANVILLIWFGLDMIGIDFGDIYLVSQAWKEDGIFFLIFLSSFLLFLFKEKIGQRVLSVWLSIWLFVQLLSHEFYTLFGGGQRKIEYFSGSLQFVKSSTRYFPDVYHVLLHILIAIALVVTIKYSIDSKKNKKV